MSQPIDLDLLERAEKAATQAPWAYGIFYWSAGVNDGSHPHWTPPDDIPRGRCNYCRKEAEPCKESDVGPHGETRHLHSDDSKFGETYDDDGNATGGEPDWHRIVSTATRATVTGNYEYESGGVCSSRADADLIVLLRNNAAALLRTARENEALRGALELNRARLEDIEEDARILAEKMGQQHDHWPVIAGIATVAQHGLTTISAALAAGRGEG